MGKILIVGGGPIGLGLAVGLIKKGIPVNVIEKASDISTFPKASTIHPPTMEILKEWGLIDEAKKIGKVVDRIQFWRRKTKQKIAELDLNLLKEYTEFPYRLHFDQQFLSRIFLNALLKEERANIRFNTELLDINQEDEKVIVQIRNDKGEVIQEQYSYVVGADGISSTVREKMGITFTGHTNPHYHMLMGLKNFELSPEYKDFGGVSAFLDDEEWVDMISNPDMLKVIIPMTHDRSDELNDEFVRNKIKEVGIVKEGFDIFYKTIYKTHQLVADKMVDGKVILIGDAAHVNIEFGGMGMNSGIHDGYLLADRFEQVLNGGDPAELFNDFANRRMEINKVVQKETIKLTKLFENVEEHEKVVRNLAANPDLATKHLLRITMIEGFRNMFADRSLQ